MSATACPTCGTPMDTTGLAPGAAVTCVGCRHAFAVPTPALAGQAHGTLRFAGATAPAGRAGGEVEPTVTPSRAAEARGAVTAVAAPVPELPGYVLQELLGRGGMGEVWRARQLSLGRAVAVKLLPVRLAGDPEFVARFDKEATALATLSHPGIVQIIDRGHVRAHYFFVMELVEGRSLREVMSQGGLTAAEALRVMLQVARAMECAHEAGIIHRDLKPENVLLDGRGHAKVADFGLAGIRGSEAGPQLTATRVAMGTLNYMAPEQRRDARSVDGRADLYSLGVLGYELLTGELPIGRFALPSQRVKGLDPAVDAVVGRLLEASPEDRYPSATPLVQELEALLSRMTGGSGQLALGVGASGGVGSSTAPAPRRRVVAARLARTGLAAVGAVALVGAAVGMLRERGALPAPVGITPPAAAAAVLAQGTTETQEGHFPPNTSKDIFVLSELTKRQDGRVGLAVRFEPGREELSAHLGHWRLEEGGVLRCTQAGTETEGKKLRPRAYLSERHFSADDLRVETTMSVAPLPPPFHPEHDGPRFGELSFRVSGVQVSIFAVPDEGMRLIWNYTAADGTPVKGTSAEPGSHFFEDHQPVPRGPFRVALSLHQVKGGVQVVGRVNGVPFARRILPGLQGQAAKVAIGCRNSDCTFEGLSIEGKPMPHSGRRMARGQD